MAKIEFATGLFSIEVMIYHDHKGHKIASNREECRSQELFSIEVMIYHDHKGHKIASNREESRSQEHQCHPGQFLQFHILKNAVKHFIDH